MPAIRDLQHLLVNLDARRVPGRFVFVAAPAERLATLPALATIREDEGWTAVLRAEDAEAAGLAYDFVAAWITLTVYSDLAAVGLTAAVSRALADAGVACTVLAGLHHDHLLVPEAHADDALAAIRALRG
ncbi:MAG: ACT domain-containing protein [Pseudomonadota bacterium]